MELKRNVSTENHRRVSYRDVWFINARPVIVSLITGGNNEAKASACQLITAWMDRCYTLQRFKFDEATNDPRSLMKEYSTKHIVRFFFEDSENRRSTLDFTKSKTGSGDKIVEVFNSLKHDGGLRKGYKFEHNTNHEIREFDPPLNPCGSERSNGNERVRLVDSRIWVWVPLIKIDKLFMAAQILNEE